MLPITGLITRSGRSPITGPITRSGADHRYRSQRSLITRSRSQITITARSRDQATNITNLFFLIFGGSINQKRGSVPPTEWTFGKPQLSNGKINLILFCIFSPEHIANISKTQGKPFCSPLGASQTLRATTFQVIPLILQGE